MSINEEEIVVKSDLPIEEINFPLLFKWCKLNTDHPYIVFGAGLSVHVFFLLLTIIFTATGVVKVFYFAFNDVPMYDSDYEPYQCFKTWRYIDILSYQFGYDYSILRNYGFQIESQEFRFYYDSVDGNILTPNNLRLINEIYDKFIGIFNKINSCMGPCVRYSTAVDILLENNGNDSTFANLDKTIEKVLKNPLYSPIFKRSLSKDLVQKNGKYFARSIKSETRIKFIVFRDLAYFIDTYFKMYNEYYSRLYIYIEYKYLLGELLLHQVFKDVYLTLGSLLYVYVFTYVQTKSCFITFFEIFSIFTTFCISNFVHTIILGIRFFGIFHVLSIFLILGLGCDNLYVFYDRWKSFESIRFISLTHRLYSTYIGVGWSIFITSITTALAFLTLAWTKLLTIFSFGVFVALLVIINYMSLLLYLPSVIVINHNKFYDVLKPDRIFVFVTRLFKVDYYNFLRYKYVKYVILVIFGLLMIGGIICVIQIKVTEEFPSLFVSRFSYSRMEYLRNNYFEKKNVDENIQIVLLIGIKRLDYKVCAYWNYTCNGAIVFDEDFLINSPGIQEQYKNICDTLSKANKNLRTELSLFEDTEHINCLLYNMDEYYRLKFPTNNFQVPWENSNFLELVNIMGPNFTAGSDFPFKFETALYYFLTDGISFSDYGKYYIYPRNKNLEKRIPIKYGSAQGYSLNLTAILVNISIFQKLSGFTEKKKIFNNWIKWTNKLNKRFNVMVCGTQEDVSMNGYFHWIHVQEILIRSALAGIIAGIIISCPIILFATLNFHTFLIIMSGTCLSTLAVTSLVYLTGWNLGLLESINLTVVVGLTIDYLVHMGLAYNSSQKKFKEEKTQDMLEEMGVSILSGMSTTLGSSFFLFFCQTKFLFQFGAFVFVTILSAGIHSLVFLPCMFLAFGPNEGDGKVHCNFYKRLHCFKNQKRSDKYK